MLKESESLYGEVFGRLAGGTTEELLLIAENKDVCAGELFLIPSNRGGKERIFLFRALDAENIMRRVSDLSRLAGTLLVEGDAYFANLEKEKLLGISGKLLGYAEKTGNNWAFRLPRRLPEHLAIVYRPTPGVTDKILREVLSSQVKGELYVGNLLAGENELNVPVYIPLSFLPSHLGIFGTTGAGKSNLVEVLIKSCIDVNLEAYKKGLSSAHRVSMVAIDPHDEFALGIDKRGIQDIVDIMDDEVRRNIIGDFYYLTPYLAAAARRVRPYARAIRILWSEITPHDILSIREVTPQQADFLISAYNKWGDRWLSEIFRIEEGEGALGHPSVTVKAVQRRLRFLQRSPIFIETGESLLTEIIEALESGRILVVNTSLLSDLEQFLFTTVVTRTLFDLRRAMKSSTSWSEFERNAYGRLPKIFMDKFREKAKRLYIKIRGEEGLTLKEVKELPVVMITVEEAPSILNPQLMKGESIFKDIARQGRKFRIGLIVISQQVTAIDNTILSNMNTEINLKLGNDEEIRAAIKNASINISGFEREFKVMNRGEAILTASYREMPVPLRIPKFDDIFEKDKEKYRLKEKVLGERGL